jgi:hypothetical protein
VRRGLGGWLLDEGARAASRAAGALLADRRGQEAVARAVGLAQRGLRTLESAQEQVLHAVGLAARPDTDDLRKRLARLRRKVRELERRTGTGAGRAPPRHSR